MTQPIDTNLPYEEQILMVEARLTRRRQREAVLSEEGRQWVIDNVETPIGALRELIRQRDAA
ncbi:hypothetical protein R5W24_000468 [Gemmata sp. JC717]|uniref:hypothetical protein n=1 Tax=Gemmata algarum TaxID=2975278 RepID=UPI0021BA5450|nr:hypothetical protein [Gemmata algarum]MDY3551392.1 hypothetical protein [Gemmata algarum]